MKILKRFNKILIAGFIFASFFGLTKPGLAVEVFLFSGSQEMVSDELIVSFGVATGADKINAVAGELSYDANRLELISTSNANSIIPLWVETPTIKDSGLVSFSGIIPGGFGGTGRIISLIFKSKVDNEDVDIAKYVQVKKIDILRNDGLGEAVETKIITPPNSLIQSINLPAMNDQTPPEAFKPILSRNDPLLGDKSYLIFNTTDKGSGVAKYFVAESKSKSEINWQLAESPYLLQDQSLRSYVYVKAVDRAGNILVAELEKRKKFYQFWWFWVIIIVGALGAGLWWKRKFL